MADFHFQNPQIWFHGKSEEQKTLEISTQWQDTSMVGTFKTWVTKNWTFILSDRAKKSYISTRSTLTPQGSVASSRVCSITWLIVSLSESISARCLVPRTFLKVVAARRWVEWLKMTKNRPSYLTFYAAIVRRVRYLKKGFFSQKRREASSTNTENVLAGYRETGLESIDGRNNLRNNKSTTWHASCYHAGYVYSAPNLDDPMFQSSIIVLIVIQTMTILDPQDFRG